MKNLSFYKEIFGNVETKQELFKLFRETLIRTHTSYDFFVDWKNVQISPELEILLTALNSLIGKSGERFDETFRQILKTIPKVITTFPYLLALAKHERNKLINGKASFDVLELEINDKNRKTQELKTISYDFSFNKADGSLSDAEIEMYLNFFKKTGLKTFFSEKLKCSLVDYVLGVLVGLDTNARKNRSGKAFEFLCSSLISDVAKEFNLDMKRQIKMSGIKKVSTFLSHLTADFLLTSSEGKLIDVEVNFYRTAGSKPIEVINSYIKRKEELSKMGIGFILISDGSGFWSKVDDSVLERTFDEIEHFMNYAMAAKGMLKKVVQNLLLIP